MAFNFKYDYLLKTSRQLLYSRANIDFPTLMEMFDQLLIDVQRSETAEDWQFHLPGTDAPDMGLIRKSSDDLLLNDDKWFFHYHPTLPYLLIENGVEYKKHAQLLIMCEQLWQQTYYNTERIITALNFKFPNIEIQERFNEFPDEFRHLVRLVRYDPGDKKQAALHADRAFLTQHIAESSPGLVYSTERKSFDSKKDKIFAFFGVKAEMLNPHWKALVHGVEKEDTSDYRWAIVTFSHIFMRKRECEVQEISTNLKKSLNPKLIAV